MINFRLEGYLENKELSGNDAVFDMEVVPG